MPTMGSNLHHNQGKRDSESIVYQNSPWEHADGDSCQRHD